MRVHDRAIGIALGIALGLAIVILFVFLGSQETIDDPSIEGGGEVQTAPSVPGGAVPNDPVRPQSGP